MPPPPPASFLTGDPIVTDIAPARTSGRALVLSPPAGPPSIMSVDQMVGQVEEESPFQDLHLNVKVRKTSPRQMAELSMELYAIGALTWDEYALLAFQPELHPDYEMTIGALIGRPAEPNRPRDYIALWEDRLAFERKHNRNRPELIDQTRHILNILHMLDVHARLRSVS